MLREFTYNFVHSWPALSLRNCLLDSHVFLLDPLTWWGQVRLFFFFLFLTLLFWWCGCLITITLRFLFSFFLFFPLFTLRLRHRLTVLMDVEHTRVRMVEESGAVDRLAELESGLKILSGRVQLQLRVILCNRCNHSGWVWRSGRLVLDWGVVCSSERSIQFNERLCRWSLRIRERFCKQRLWLIWVSAWGGMNLLISRLGAGRCLLSSGLVRV